ncbi:hypothetical protein E4U41_000411 [Claviceps citrina]|nr:hypothetical protein E4U41_000411 [Claviceps citrina]
MPSTPTPLAPTPPSHQSGVIHGGGKKKPTVSQSPSTAAQRTGVCRATAAAAGSPATAATPPARAPLPTKQPRTLPCLSAPPTTDRMAMAAVNSPGPADVPKISMTSKEWVIPPRPKPGRKPATDTPPTKRKAQNRAAQRAFRERRAARVGELEQQLDEIRDDHHKEESELKDRIHSLELDLQSFRSRCLLLENMLDRERQDRLRAESEAENLRRRLGDDCYRSQNMNGPGHSYSRPHSPTHHPLRLSLSDGRRTQLAQSRDFHTSQIITPPLSLDISSNNPNAEAVITCGNCSPNGPCACAEEILASAPAGCGKCTFGAPCQCLDEVLGQGQELKRPVSSSADWSEGKRQRTGAEAYLTTETDFTAMFSRKSAPSTAPEPSPYEQSAYTSQMPSGVTMGAFKESCGFCKDGTYCVCAEDAAGMTTPAKTPIETMHSSSHQTQTPPPSEPDVFPAPVPAEVTADGAVKLPRRTAATKPASAVSSSSGGGGGGGGGCGSNGPGTCAQCRADPKSGLFCRLMNAKYNREQGTPGGCCGGRGAGGGCCKSEAAAGKMTLPSLPSLGLSCAEAYQTLSSHRNFSKAADDISSWLPKLKTTTAPGPVVRGCVSGRQAVEVEAASIMSVLKEFDVRFGRDA